MLVHQTETIADLQGLSFGQLVSALQTRLDTPELSLFAVDGEQVSVRVGGVMQPLHASRGAPPAAELPRPAAGVRVVETTLQQRPAPAPQQAPRPAQGLSVRGQPTSGAAGAPPARPAEPPPSSTGPSPSPGAAPAAAAPPSKADERPTADGDDAAARFSLLELD